MGDLQNIFETSLKKHKGSKVDLLILENFIPKLHEELPKNFIQWLQPRTRDHKEIDPIAKVNIEVDSEGYLYCSLYNKTGRCVVSQGGAPDLYDWGIAYIAESDFEIRQELVAQFLALCYKAVLPLACQSAEFLALPREDKIIFNIGAHGGWQYDELYIYQD